MICRQINEVKNNAHQIHLMLNWHSFRANGCLTCFFHSVANGASKKVRLELLFNIYSQSTYFLTRQLLDKILKGLF